LDATLIRILFVVLAVLGGSGLVLYLAMDHRPQRAVSRGVIQPGTVHPIPVALLHRGGEVRVDLVSTRTFATAAGDLHLKVG
jgi:hypothetical protein